MTGCPVSDFILTNPLLRPRICPLHSIFLYYWVFFWEDSRSWLLAAKLTQNWDILSWRWKKDITGPCYLCRHQNTRLPKSRPWKCWPNLTLPLIFPTLLPQKNLRHQPDVFPSSPASLSKPCLVSNPHPQTLASPWGEFQTWVGPRDFSASNLREVCHTWHWDFYLAIVASGRGVFPFIESLQLNPFIGAHWKLVK